MERLARRRHETGLGIVLAEFGRKMRNEENPQRKRRSTHNEMYRLLPDGVSMRQTQLFRFPGYNHPNLRPTVARSHHIEVRAALKTDHHERARSYALRRNLGRVSSLHD